jgi:hypothetical protein
MRLVLLLALAVTGCESAVAITTPPPVRPPSNLLVCPVAPPPVPVPPPPRGFDAVVAFGRETDARREETVKALEICRRSLEKLQRWAQERG